MHTSAAYKYSFANRTDKNRVEIKLCHANRGWVTHWKPMLEADKHDKGPTTRRTVSLLRETKHQTI